MTSSVTTNQSTLLPLGKCFNFNLIFLFIFLYTFQFFFKLFQTSLSIQQNTQIASCNKRLKIRNQ